MAQESEVISSLMTYKWQIKTLKMFSFIGHPQNANQNHNKIALHTY